MHPITQRTKTARRTNDEASIGFVLVGCEVLRANGQRINGPLELRLYSFFSSIIQPLSESRPGGELTWSFSCDRARAACKVETTLILSNVPADDKHGRW